MSDHAPHIHDQSARRMHDVQAARRERLQRWLNAFCPIRELGRFHDVPRAAPDLRPASTPDHPETTEPPSPSLPLFLERTRELLATVDDEAQRRRLEAEVLTLAAPLHRAGVFDVLQVVHPPLRHMIADHFAERPNSEGHRCSA